MPTKSPRKKSKEVTEDTPTVKKKKKKIVKKVVKDKAPVKNKKQEPSHKFDVAYLAGEMNTSPANLRSKLRENKIKKEGKSYGWNTKAEIAEVIKSLTK
jgi:hypothetical protein